MQESSLKDLDELKDLIAGKQAELDDVLPRFQSQKDEEEKLNSLYASSYSSTLDVTESSYPHTCKLSTQSGSCCFLAVWPLCIGKHCCALISYTRSSEL